MNPKSFSSSTARGQRRLRLIISTLLVSAFIVVTMVTSASAFWSWRNLDPFNPDAGAPRPYDPSAVGIVGDGNVGGNSSDCYWSREQTFVGGRLTWRPLLMCPYPRD